MRREKPSRTKIFFTALMAFCAVFLLHIFQADAATNQWNTITPSGTSGYAFNTVAAIGNYVYLGTDHGVYKSLDGGNTWSQMSSGLGAHLNITAIAIGWVYNSGANAYATTSSSFVFVGTSDGGVFSSTLGGIASTTWTATSTGLSGSGLDILDLKIDQSQATQGSYTDLYAATPNGVYVSTTTGSFWQLDNSGLSGQPTKLVTDYGNAVVYVLTNGNQIYSSALYSSSHALQSWTSVFNANGTTTNDVSIINVVGGIGWLATSKGIYKSDTDGANWASTNIGLPASAVDNVASDYLDQNIAYASVPGSGVYRTKDEAVDSGDPQIPEWLPINIGLSDLNIKEVKTDPSSFMVAYAVGANGLYKLIYGSTPIENVDMTPPSDVTNLSAATTSAPYIVDLAWTAPGNNGVYGTSTTYDLRYSTSTTITSGNFSSAIPVVPEPTPYGSGYAETYQFAYTEQPYDLSQAGQLFFALKAYDAAGNSSDLSNVVTIAISTTSLSISGGSPSGSLPAGTSQATLSVNTNDNAVCKYGTLPYVSYPYAVPTNTFSTTGGTSHSTVVTDLSNDQSYAYYVNCTSISNSTGSNYTISFSVAPTPSNSSSSSGSYSGSYSGGGGGGGGGYVPLTVAASSTPSVPGCPVGFSCMPKPVPGCPSGFICAPIPVTTPTISTPAYAPITNASLPSQDLTLGSQGSAVTTLQNFLIGQGDLGYQYNTGYFGSLTQTALAKFQAANGITPASGYYGSKTRAFIEGGTSTTSAQTYTLAPNTNFSSAGEFTRNLSIGMNGQDVLLLQQTLNNLGYTIATSGAGSPGNESTYFGLKTQIALEKYQCAKGIVCSGDLGSGVMGPKTIASFEGKAIPAIAIPPITPAPVKASVPAAASTPVSTIPTLPVSTASVSGLPLFTAPLTTGMANQEVKELKIFLNDLGFTVVTTSTTSLQSQASTYNAATAVAVKQFQQAYAQKIASYGGGSPSGQFDGPTMETANSLISP